MTSQICLVDSSLRDGMHSGRPQLLARAGGGGRGRARPRRRRRDRGLARRRRRRLLDPVRPLRLPRRGADRGGRGRGHAARGSPRCCCRGSGRCGDCARRRRSAPRIARVATHCTEADIAEQHIAWAAAHGMTAVGFLMMSHMIEPAALAEQARLMESYGATVVYIVDSAGALVPRTAAARVAALRAALDARDRRSASTPTTTSAAASATRSPPPTPARAGSTARCAASAPAPATPSWRCWRRRWSAPGRETRRRAVPADGRRRGGRRAASWRGRRSSTAPRCRSATPASTARSCCTPSGRRRSSASSRATC